MPTLDVSELNIVLGVLGKIQQSSAMTRSFLFLTSNRPLHPGLWHHLGQDQEQMVSRRGL